MALDRVKLRYHLRFGRVHDVVEQLATAVDAAAADARGELGSVERASDFTTTSIASPGEDIPLMTLTFTVDARPIFVYFGCSDMSHSAIGGGIPCSLGLFEEASLRGLHRGQGSVASARIPVGSAVARFDVDGEHIVRLTAFSDAAGTLTVHGAAGAPIHLHAVEV